MLKTYITNILNKYPTFFGFIVPILCAILYFAYIFLTVENTLGTLRMFIYIGLGFFYMWYVAIIAPPLQKLVFNKQHFYSKHISNIYPYLNQYLQENAPAVLYVSPKLHQQLFSKNYHTWYDKTSQKALVVEGVYDATLKDYSFKPTPSDIMLNKIETIKDIYI